MVKPGYMNTEIGSIPKSWKVSILGHHATICRGGSPRPIQAYLTQAANGLNWIKIGDVRPDDKYITATREKIIPEGLSKTREVAEGDFLLSNSMSFGRPYILKIKGCIHDGWLTIQNYKHTFDTDFLYYYLSSDAVLWQYISMAAGSGVQNLNKEKVAAVTLAIPPIDEQKRIATALSDIDALIANLEKLIAKKKAIKLGAMQELLTGKRRLPGFDEEWMDSSIGDICELVSGGTPSTSVAEYWDGDIPWCTPTDITSCNGKYLYKTADSITILGLANSSATMLPEGALLLCTRATIGAVKITAIPICTNQGFKSLVVRDCADNEWLYYAIQMLKKEMVGQAIGSTFLEISRKALANIHIKLPSKEEQKAIAGILSDMDSEICELEQKYRKYCLIKQGMMSELLTGRIRLIDKEDA